MEKTLKLQTIKRIPINQIQAYIKHQIWLAIQKKCEMKERYELGEYPTQSKFLSEINIQNGRISALKDLHSDLGKVASGMEVEFQKPTKTYENPKKHNSLEINQLDEQYSQLIDNQSVTY